MFRYYVEMISDLLRRTYTSYVLPSFIFKSQIWRRADVIKICALLLVSTQSPDSFNCKNRRLKY